MYIENYLVRNNNRNGDRPPEKIKTAFSPIKSPSEEREIEILVDKILSIKKQNPSADSVALENEIDPLVLRFEG